MDEQITITKVRDKLAMIQAEINVAKRRLLDLEAAAKKLTTTLEVLENLDQDAVPTLSTTAWVKSIPLSTLTDFPTLSAGTSFSPSVIVKSLFSPTTRQLIVAEFVQGESLTTNEVAERVSLADSTVNRGTVATTLSKLTAEGILERVEGNAYRLKADPRGPNTVMHG